MQVTMQVHTQSSCLTTDLEVEEVLLAITTPHRDAIVVMISHSKDRGRRRGEGRVQIADIRSHMEVMILTSRLAKGGEEATRGIKELKSIIV
jgi:hypothetical protein